MNRAVIAGAFAGFLAVVVLIVAIGGDEGGSETAEGGELSDTTQKPAVEVPEGEPPGQLQIEDIVVGEGPSAEQGDAVSVQYVGVDYDSGAEFDSSWERGEPFTFELGAGEVIEGWDEGVAGMQPGGRRQLTIPPDLAYGAAGSPPAIGPEATLVFVVDLVEVAD